MTPSFVLTGEFRSAYQEHLDTTDVPLGPERSGNQTDVGLGGRILAASSMVLSPGYGWTRKQALRDYNAFDRHSFTLDYSWLLKRGFVDAATLSMG